MTITLDPVEQFVGQLRGLGYVIEGEIEELSASVAECRLDQRHYMRLGDVWDNEIPRFDRRLAPEPPRPWRAWFGLPWLLEHVTRSHLTRQPRHESRSPRDSVGSAKAFEYRLCPLTNNDVRDWYVWTVRVRRHRDDLWAIESMFEVLNRAGDWEHDPLTADNRVAWEQTHCFDLHTALRLADWAQWTLQVNGKTATDMLEQRTRQAAP